MFFAISPQKQRIQPNCAEKISNINIINKKKPMINRKADFNLFSLILLNFSELIILKILLHILNASMHDVLTSKFCETHKWANQAQR